VAERLTTDTVGANTVWSGDTSLGPESARIPGRYREISGQGRYPAAWMTLGYSGGYSGASFPGLTLWNDRAGKIDVTMYDAPALRMYADTSIAAIDTGPQFEFRFRKGWAPEIVLRDVHGQVVWRAP
jgi:hypothetical protein